MDSNSSKQLPLMTQRLWLLWWLLCWAHVTANAEDSYSSSSICLIRATLYMTPAEQRSASDFGLPLDIDCSLNLSSASAWDMGAQRVAGKPHVLLDGSQTPPLSMTSYGLEYLDNCANLQSLEVERFVSAVSLPISCAGDNLEQLSSLTFRHNELGTLSSSLCQTLPHLKQLKLVANSLRLLEPLLNCSELEDLSILQEEELLLDDGNAFSSAQQLRRLELRQLKLLRPAFFAQLPGNLATLLVEHTPIVERQLHISQADYLVNISIVHCQLIKFSYRQLEAPARLLHLNLSGNAIIELELEELGSLRTLDLSENELVHLNANWFQSLPNLEQLHLQNNHLETLSLALLLHIAPRTLQQLDLRGNQLIKLDDALDKVVAPPQQLRIQIDRNPWSCQWLLNFTHAQPQFFRLFQYAKYISHINVNGLTCKPEPTIVMMLDDEEREIEVKSLPGYSMPPSNDPGLEHRSNTSTFTVFYGNPVEIKRSQRQGALIITFMLPLGIALLFLLLYLYLHCERLFHLSYYISGLQCWGNKSSSSHFIERVDIVRFPTANGNGDLANSSSDAAQLEDGYETPLREADAPSICNCSQRPSNCSRLHHVTYEALPTELPYQVYSEIKDQQACEEEAAPSAPIYDHLSFREESPPFHV